jgi:hypothetical protein
MFRSGPDHAEDPAAIAAAVRDLATEAHLVMTRAAAGRADDHRAALGDLRRRIDQLQHLLGELRPGESRLHSLRIWLDHLEHQVLLRQQVEDLRRRVDLLEGQRDAPPDAGGGCR